MANWFDDREQNERIGREFMMRFQAFRYMESQCLVAIGDPIIAPEAWRLLHDLELAYSARAYSACFCLVCAMIEIHFRKVARYRGKLSQMVRAAGLEAELGWMIVLRNDIMHGNPSPFAPVDYRPLPEAQKVLEDYCVRAFAALHTIAAKVPAQTA